MPVLTSLLFLMLASVASKWSAIALAFAAKCPRRHVSCESGTHDLHRPQASDCRFKGKHVSLLFGSCQLSKHFHLYRS
jgi:hypothetical protein